MNEYDDAIHQIATLASARALTWFAKRNDVQIDEKSGKQFVSEADFDVEQLIRKEVLKRFPDDPIVGEEYGGADQKKSPDQTVWYVDPIDGTSNFLNGSPLWGISIGIARDNKPLAGVIVLPVLGLSGIATTCGHFIDLGGKPLDRVYPPVPTMAVGWSTNQRPKESSQQVVQVRDQGFEVVMYRCSTVSLLFAALGYVDGYVETKTNAWDIAAGWAICEAAGLNVSGKFDGKPTEQSIAVGFDTNLV